MRFRLLAKWFAIGFVVRLILGALVFLMILFVNWEAAMLHLLDLPTMLCLSVLERVDPSLGGIGGGQPYYVSFNLVAGAVWGALFALGAFLFNILVPSRRRARVS